MKIKSIFVHTDSEVLHKLTKEILDLFHINAGEGTSEWEVFVETKERCTTTTLVIDKKSHSLSETAFSDEKPSGAIHRLYKKHLYEILRKLYNFPAAPWGILYGVRPTKIVHRYFKSGLTVDEIFKRLVDGYHTSEEKANLLLEVSEREQAVLKNFDDKKISVYVGIPFCLTKCFYCSFPSHVLPNEKKLQEFMAVFKRDLLDAKKLVQEHNLRVENIYIGGGTPTSLPDALFEEMLNLVTDSFATSDLIEYTLEAGRPDSMSERKYDLIKNSPVNRVSVNPQTFNDETLKRIGRLHTAEDIVKMYKNFRKCERLAINMDLILGLSGETAKDAKNTVTKTIELDPDNITLHALAKKRGSKLKTAIDESVDVNLPSDEEVQKMAKVSHSLIRNARYFPYYLYRQGYMAGGLENVGFSKTNKESLYNIRIIEENQTIIGVGGAATTKLVASDRIKAVFHPKDLITYLRDIDVYIDKRRKLLGGD